MNINKATTAYTKAIDARQYDQLLPLLEQHPGLLTARTEAGMSLLLLSAYHRQSEIVAYFLDQRESLDFFEAVATGQLAQVEQHLTHDIGLLNSYAPDGFTALGLASYFGQTEVVEHLLAQGADPNLAANNPTQIAPLHAAIAINSVPIAKLLLLHQADPNLPQQQGITALHSAAHRGNQPLVALLLDHGADPSLLTADGKRAVDFARADGHQHLLELLAVE